MSKKLTKKMSKKWLVATGVALAAAVSWLPVGSAQAASVRINGSLGASGAGYQVLLVSQDGETQVAVATASGGFSFKTTTDNARQATLQIVDAKNRYVGPIVIAKEKVGKTWCAHTRLSGKTVNLKKLTFNPSKGFAITKKAPKSTTFARSAVVAKNQTGQPLAAGGNGIAKASAAKQKTCRKAKVGTASVTAFDADTDMGADLDSDGLPNTLDADDDGDTIIDAVDQSTSGGSARMNPWVNLRSDDPLFNASLTAGITPTDIAEVLGEAGNYGIQFFIQQNNFVEGEKGSTLNAVKYAWVDCGDLVYCGGSAPTAYTTQTHLINNNTGVPWNTYYGGFKVETDSAPATPGFTVDGVDPQQHGNNLFLMNRNSQNDPGYVYWLASLFPNQGAQTLNTVKPGDVFTVRFVTANGEEKSIAMMINPHAVTVPGLTTVNGAAYTGSTLTTDADGKLALKFFRPQRLATTGETNADGTAATYKDMGGLRYGIIYMGSNDTPCSTSHYSNYTTDFTPTTNSDRAAQLWPLYDKQTTDIDTSSSSAQLQFTIDMKSCLGSAWNTLASGAEFNIQLVGAGENLTGGANRSALDLRVRKP
jgi:hypothetical protein